MKGMKYWMIAAVVIILAACSNDTEHKLEGKWQLQQVEANGEVIQADTVFYNFQNILFMYQVYLADADSVTYQYGFNTLKDETSLVLELADDPRSIAKFLPRTDWNSATREFTIEKLSGKQLILNSEGKRYIFRKF
ncbi:lipocalin-like domain-containing protein [Parabacteroides faecis]|uniref:lipocalin-like domain-containing protein n=1 Tax=Parabacteroides faecis TaxID=1217282 RepID=UPI002164B145|nr:lipocalin-like domain-containing protein [Parabacteroides faecis]MCS2893065.1 lipocalin-like domain-containing protein [Parabacteroides faecis]UVQ48324.1 lipocalin-like domain-containing protein [Parabacteroides faecis]